MCPQHKEILFFDCSLFRLLARMCQGLYPTMEMFDQNLPMGLGGDGGGSVG
tara:strand:+ start:440 stop:592 length:153 start_codon:yes stop_codon:yes gene_type:complete